MITNVKVQGTIDNATNITEAISMLTSRYRSTSKLTIEGKEVRFSDGSMKFAFEFTLEYEEEI